MSNYRKKKSFLVLTLGKILEALGSGIGTGLVFCLSFSVPNNVSALWTKLKKTIMNHIPYLQHYNPRLVFFQNYLLGQSNFCVILDNRPRKVSRAARLTKRTMAKITKS